MGWKFEYEPLQSMNKYVQKIPKSTCFDFAASNCIFGKLNVVVFTSTTLPASDLQRSRSCTGRSSPPKCSSFHGFLPPCPLHSPTKANFIFSSCLFKVLLHGAIRRLPMRSGVEHDVFGVDLASRFMDRT